MVPLRSGASWPSPSDLHLPIDTKEKRSARGKWLPEAYSRGVHYQHTQFWHLLPFLNLKPNFAHKTQDGYFRFRIIVMWEFINN